MKVLGIESSCDETAVAIVNDNFQVSYSAVSSQVDLHRVFGGVVPEVAARAHLDMLAPMAADLNNHQGHFDDIDAIAVTQGPGLIGSLLVGVSFAKGLALALDKPLVPVDHVHAHIYGALLEQEKPTSFPALALVASGGHTNLYYMASSLDFSLIASTIDDACGECFDKVAKAMGFAYPGGPEIEKLAKEATDFDLHMPKIVSEKSRMEFSYSGLKTHCINLVRSEKFAKADICHGFQKAAFDQIVRKISAALELYPDSRSVIIAGGVAANSYFKDELEKLPVPCTYPKLKYCSDNAAMIAALGIETLKQEQHLENDLSWDVYARYDFGKWLRDV